jgi:hypothetical protein
VKDFNLCKSLSVICFYYKKLISCPCLNLLLLITFKDLISFVCPLSTLLIEWKLDLLIKDFEKYIDKYLNTLVLIIPQFNTIFTFLLAWNACSGHMFCGIKKNVEVGKSQILKKKKINVFLSGKDFYMKHIPTSENFKGLYIVLSFYTRFCCQQKFIFTFLFLKPKMLQNIKLL